MDSRFVMQCDCCTYCAVTNFLACSPPLNELPLNCTVRIWVISFNYHRMVVLHVSGNNLIITPFYLIPITSSIMACKVW